MLKRIILHPINIDEWKIGGIETCIRDMIYWSDSKEVEWELWGLSTRKIGSSNEKVIKGKRYVTRVLGKSRASNTRIFPDTLRLLLGILSARADKDSIFQVHRIDTLLLVKLFFPSRLRIVYLHGPINAAISKSSDSFWRFFPVVYKSLVRVLLKNENVKIFSADGHAQLSQIGIKSVQVHTWYDPETHYMPTDNQDKETIIWVGRFEAPKRPDLLIHFIDIVLKQLPSTRFIVVGDGSLRADFDNWLGTFDASGNVTTFLELSSSDLARQYRAARWLLMTSSFEGSPRVLVEGLACGLRPLLTRESDPSNLTSGDWPLCGDAGDLAAHFISIKDIQTTVNVERFSAKFLVQEVL